MSRNSTNPLNFFDIFQSSSGSKQCIFQTRSSTDKQRPSAEGTNFQQEENERQTQRSKFPLMTIPRDRAQIVLTEDIINQNKIFIGKIRQIQQYSDQLQVWIDYLNWLKQINVDDSQKIKRKYEKMLQYFLEADNVYFQDVRLLELWFEYAQMCYDKEEIFAFMEKQQIGTKHLKFYQKISQHYENEEKNYEKANEYLLDAQNRKVAPPSDIQELLTQFERRMEERLERDFYSNDSCGFGISLSSAGSQQQPRFGQKRPYGQAKSPTAKYKRRKTIYPETLKSKDGFEIYVDPQNRPSLFSRSTGLINEYLQLRRLYGPPESEGLNATQMKDKLPLSFLSMDSKLQVQLQQSQDKLESQFFLTGPKVFKDPCSGAYDQSMPPRLCPDPNPPFHRTAEHSGLLASTNRLINSEIKQPASIEEIITPKKLLKDSARSSLGTNASKKSPRANPLSESKNFDLDASSIKRSQAKEPLDGPKNTQAKSNQIQFSSITMFDTYQARFSRENNEVQIQCAQDIKRVHRQKLLKPALNSFKNIEKLRCCDQSVVLPEQVQLCSQEDFISKSLSKNNKRGELDIILSSAHNSADSQTEEQSANMMITSTCGFRAVRKPSQQVQSDPISTLGPLPQEEVDQQPPANEPDDERENMKLQAIQDESDKENYIINSQQELMHVNERNHLKRLLNPPHAGAPSLRLPLQDIQRPPGMDDLDASFDYSFDLQQQEGFSTECNASDFDQCEQEDCQANISMDDSPSWPGKKSAEADRSGNQYLIRLQQPPFTKEKPLDREALKQLQSKTLMELNKLVSSSTFRRQSQSEPEEDELGRAFDVGNWVKNSSLSSDIRGKSSPPEIIEIYSINNEEESAITNPELISGSVRPVKDDDRTPKPEDNSCNSSVALLLPNSQKYTPLRQISNLQVITEASHEQSSARISNFAKLATSTVTPMNLSKNKNNSLNSNN